MSMSVSVHRGAVRVLRFDLMELLRTRAVVFHGLFFLAATWALLFFSEDTGQTLVSLLQLMLLVVPLAGLVFGTLYFYNSSDFLELLLAQPVDRRSVYLGHYLGLAFPLSAVFALGVLVPFGVYRVLGRIELSGAVPMLLISGVLLTFSTTAIAYLIGMAFSYRVRGLSAALFAWIGLSFVYDALVLGVTILFRDWPLEGPMIALSFLNPLDLARVTVMLRLDTAALMGYTGAVFEKFFGTFGGLALSLGVLALWAVVPAAIGFRWFGRKDF